MGQTYTISDLSKEFGVTTRTIRHYEAERLLTPERDGRNRIYSARDRVHLKLILRGKRLGFSLKEIAELFEIYDAPNGEVSQLKTFIGKMHARRETLLKQRDDIDRVLGELDRLESRCSELLNARDKVTA